MANDHAQASRREQPGGFKHVRKKRAAGKGMQDLGLVRVHALALARSQNDDLQGGGGERHENQSRAKAANKKGRG
jgi:hypothetical protein